MIAEPKDWTTQRRQRMQMQYPELSVAETEDVLRVDAENVARGMPPSTFSQAARRLAAHAAKLKQ